MGQKSYEYRTFHHINGHTHWSDVSPASPHQTCYVEVSDGLLASTSHLPQLCSAFPRSCDWLSAVNSHQPHVRPAKVPQQLSDLTQMSRNNHTALVAHISHTVSTFTFLPHYDAQQAAPPHTRREEMNVYFMSRVITDSPDSPEPSHTFVCLEI